MARLCSPDDSSLDSALKRRWLSWRGTKVTPRTAALNSFHWIRALENAEASARRGPGPGFTGRRVIGAPLPPRGTWAKKFESVTAWRAGFAFRPSTSTRRKVALGTHPAGAAATTPRRDSGSGA